MTEEAPIELIELTSEIVAAYVSNNGVAARELPDLIASTYTALRDAAGGKGAEPEPPALVPAVPIKKSIAPDFLISLETGQKFKSLRRHLATRGMTPDEYRAKWGLPKDYPMVSASYSAQRSSLAKSLGLGRKPAEPAPAPKKGKGRAAKPAVDATNPAR